MRHLTPLRICLGAIVVIGLGALFVSIGASKPEVSLSVVGFKTNTIAGSEMGLATNLEYVCAIVCMTNCGTRSVTFVADGSTPSYTTIRQIGMSWSESPVFGCGLTRGDKTLSPGQSVTFTAIVELDAPCWISVSYRASDFRVRWRRLLPAWLVQRVGWFSNDPTVTTPMIRLDGKITPNHGLQRTRPPHH